MKGDLRQVARTIFEQTLTDCSIRRGFAEKVKAADHASAQDAFWFGDHLVNFSALKHVRVIAAGKAAAPMLDAFLDLLPRDSWHDLRGVLIAPEAPTLPRGFTFFAGGHPFPNEDSFAGASAVLAMLQELPPDASPANTLCVFLISGGSSAMLELPLDTNITLEETVAFHRALVHSGASIMEINCARKHFSAVKGGRLAMAAQPATRLTILLSDVPRGEIDSIGSGPTVPDTSTASECRQILERYHLMEQFPPSIQRFFAAGDMPETVKSLDPESFTWTLLSADDLAEAARRRAAELGFFTVVDNSCDGWDYREVAPYLLRRIRTLRREHNRACLISAGEITVRPEAQQNHGIAMVSGNGGRNQHFALYTATILEPQDGPIAILSAGSDGIDGHSEAAGAVVDASTLCPLDAGPEGYRRLRSAAQEALQQFNSSTFLTAMDATIVTGPTGNNLRDLRILIADAQPDSAE